MVIMEDIMQYEKIYLMLRILHLTVNVPRTDNIRAAVMDELMGLDASLVPSKIEAALSIEEVSDEKTDLEDRRI